MTQVVQPHYTDVLFVLFMQAYPGLTRASSANCAIKGEALDNSRSCLDSSPPIPIFGVYMRSVLCIYGRQAVEDPQEQILPRRRL